MKETAILYQPDMVRAKLELRKTQTRRVVKPQPYFDGKWWIYEPKGKNHPTGSPWYCSGNSSWNPISLGVLDFWESRGGSPYGAPGDRLWGRESFAVESWEFLRPSAQITVKGHYLADNVPFETTLTPKESAKFFEWKKKTGGKPGIFMFRSLSRIVDEITEVRVQRVQEISAGDVIAEGVQLPVTSHPTAAGKKTPLLRITGKHLPDKVYTEKPLKEWTEADWWRAHYASLWDSINASRGHPWSANPWVWAITTRPIQPQPPVQP